MGVKFQILHENSKNDNKNHLFAKFSLAKVNNHYVKKSSK